MTASAFFEGRRLVRSNHQCRGNYAQYLFASPAGWKQKYIFFCVGLMLLGPLANIGLTASGCQAVELALHYGEYSGGAVTFL